MIFVCIIFICMVFRIAVVIYFLQKFSLWSTLQAWNQRLLPILWMEYCWLSIYWQCDHNNIVYCSWIRTSILLYDLQKENLFISKCQKRKYKHSMNITDVLHGTYIVIGVPLQLMAWLSIYSALHIYKTCPLWILGFA